MDWTMLNAGVLWVLALVLAAEASNGLSDAPVGTSAAVASGVLTSRRALWVTAIGNFAGLIAALVLGAAVATTIGTGIVRPEAITIGSIGVAMATSIVWALLAVWLGFPVSKTHALLATLAGIGYAKGGFNALLRDAVGHRSLCRCHGYGHAARRLAYSSAPGPDGESSPGAGGR